MKSQLCRAERENWLKPVPAQRTLQRAPRVRRQRHACVQGGASSPGCGVTIMTARTRGLASRPVARTVMHAINSRNDRTGLTRCAVFLLYLIAVHAIRNLHVFKGPGDFNVYGYFYVRLYRTGFGFQANLVEEYVWLSAPLPHLRWFGEDLGSGAVSWLDERSIELGHHWFDVAHGHYHPPLPIPFRRY